MVRNPSAAPVEQVLVVGINVLQQVVLDDALVKRRAGNRAVNEELRQGRFEFHQAVQFLRHHFLVLVIKSDDHRGQNGDAVLAKFGENVRDRPALLFGVIGARPFVTDPEAVNPHLQNFLDGVLADGLDAGEGEDGKFLAALHHAIAELHRPLFVEQKILIQDEEDQVRVRGRGSVPRRRKCPCPPAAA